MTWRLLARATWAGLLVFLGQAAQAFYVPPPEPVQIHFQAGRDQLTPAGEAAVDSLAVRGAKCPDGRLRVMLIHGADGVPSRTEARYRAIHQRLAGLGLAAIYVNRTSGRSAPDAVRASVTSDGSEYCDGSDSALLRQWVGRIAQHVARPSSGGPDFWSRMTPAVRRGDLALTLANTAYCQQREGPRLSNCVTHPEVFAWLAERAGMRGPREVREHWLLALWSAVDDATLAQWQRKLHVGELPVPVRASQVPALVASDLPWPVVEQRLLSPGVMGASASQARYARFPVAASVVEAAVARRQIDALPRLIEAAGEHAWGIHWELIFTAAEVPSDADSERLLGLLPAAPAGWPTWGGMLTEVLVIGAYCPGAVPGSPQRFADIWERLLAGGFKPDAQTLKSLTGNSHSTREGQCWIQALPGQPYRFQRVP